MSVCDSDVHGSFSDPIYTRMNIQTLHYNNNHYTRNIYNECCVILNVFTFLLYFMWDTYDTQVDNNNQS
jgi:hypothetical protein